MSAAAGAGKTAVLAQRCVHLVCDANPPCDVARLLVVTFTDSAAAEMKTRIKAALRRRFEENPSDRLQRQADLVEHARISTVHSFCANVLRQNFHLVGLDPNFRILDGDDAHLIRTETAADLLERRYESDETGDFSRLVDAFGQGDDGHLSEKIIHTHQLLCSLSNPEDWKARTLADIRQAADVPLAQSRLGRQLLALIEQTLADLSGNLPTAPPPSDRAVTPFRRMPISWTNCARPSSIGKQYSTPKVWTCSSANFAILKFPRPRAI